jgi:hypothetical protein
MTVNSMPVHHTQHPKLLDRMKIFLYQETVLIDLVHLGNISGPCPRSDLLYDVPLMLDHRLRILMHLLGNLLYVAFCLINHALFLRIRSGFGL